MKTGLYHLSRIFITTEMVTLFHDTELTEKGERLLVVSQLRDMLKSHRHLFAFITSISLLRHSCQSSGEGGTLYSLTCCSSKCQSFYQSQKNYFLSEMLEFAESLIRLTSPKANISLLSIMASAALNHGFSTDISLLSIKEYQHRSAI